MYPNRNSHRLPFLRAPLVFVYIALGACSDAGTPASPADEAPPTIASTPNQIRFFAGTGDQTTPLSVGPDPSLWLSDGNEASRAMSPDLLTYPS